MSKKRPVKKSIHVIMIFLLALICISSFKPINVSSDEERTTMTHEERTQYHLIKVVQRKLLELGYYPGPVNGINGPRTQKAIKEFQKDHGLAVDGIPGPKTLKSLGF